MGATSSKHIVIIHENAVVASRLAHWLQADYEIASVVFGSLSDFSEHGDELDAMAILIANSRLPSPAHNSRTVFEQHSEVPFVVLDEHCDKLRKQLWRRLGAAGCADPDTLGSALRDVIEPL